MLRRSWFRCGPLRAVVALSGGVDSSVAGYLMVHHADRNDVVVVGAAHSTNWTSDSEVALDEVSDEVGAATDAKPPKPTLPAVCSRELESAREVASILKLPFLHCDFEAEYYNDVMQPTVKAFSRGGSFNPDCECNRRIKFGPFLDLVLKRFDADVLVTGHYANNGHVRVAQNAWNSAFDAAGHAPLHQATDMTSAGSLWQPVAWRTNDQSFFLSTVPRCRLHKAVFPLGVAPNKIAVRDLARRVGLPTAAKPTSTGLCFVGERDFGRLMQEQVQGAGLPTDLWRPGELMEDLRDANALQSTWPEEAPLGRPLSSATFRLFEHGRSTVATPASHSSTAMHRGVAHYTMGQRLPLRRSDTGTVEQWYVTWKCNDTNRLFVVPRPGGGPKRLVDRRLLYREVRVTNFEVHDEVAWSKTVAFFAVLRHLQPPLRVEPPATGGGSLLRSLNSHDGFRAPTPGQVVVVYGSQLAGEEGASPLVALATGTIAR